MDTQKPLLIETDIGRDLDDYLAICFLDALGVEIAAISVSPGDPDQLALVAGLRAELYAKWKFGPSVLGRKKRSLAGVHLELRQEQVEPDGWGPNLFAEALERGPCDLLTIGPMHAIDHLLTLCPNTEFNRVLIQGGFCSYRVYAPSTRLNKFDHKEAVPTFNLNGCREGAKLLLAAKCAERRLVGKNICHTVVGLPSMLRGKIHSQGSKLFQIALAKHFAKKPEKALHDVVAAACYVDPSLGKWLRGRPFYRDGCWGTALEPDWDFVLVDLDYARFWEMVGL